MLAIYDIELVELALFNDKTEAAKYIGVSRSTIDYNLHGKSRCFMGKYILFNELEPKKSKRGRKY